MWNNFAKEYHTIVKKDEWQLYSSTWMNLTSMRDRQITKEHAYYNFVCINFKHSQA